MKHNPQKLQKDLLCETAKEAHSEGEQLEIKEFATYKLIDPSCAQTIAQLLEEDLYDMVKEGEYRDYIERWFHEVTQPKHHSFIQHLLM